MENIILCPLLLIGIVILTCVFIFMWFSGFIYPRIEQKYNRYILVTDELEPYEVFDITTRVYYKGQLVWAERDRNSGLCKMKQRKVEAKIICEKLSKLK